MNEEDQQEEPAVDRDFPEKQRFKTLVARSDLSTGDCTPLKLETRNQVITTILLPSPPDAGTKLFVKLFPSPDELFTNHLTAIYKLLSIPFPVSHPSVVSLVVSPTDGGVAYTSNATIVFSSAYIAAQSDRLDNDADRAREISGVLLHEAVHVVQNSGDGCPGWWIEGLSDWCRLKCDLGAKHWKKLGEGDHWTNSYETTGLFLLHLTNEVRPEICSEINSKLGKKKWKDEWFEELTQKSLDKLWKEYKAFYEDKSKGSSAVDAEPPKAVPTHQAS